MKDSPSNQLREAAKKSYGDSYDEEVFLKALAKAKRRMKNAYGFVDTKGFIGEFGTDGIITWYSETVNDPTGIDTFNRETRRS